MMNIIFSWGFLSGFLIFFSWFPYAVAIYTREIKKPVLSTLGIWMVLGLFFLLNASESGSTIENTKLAIWMGFIGPSVTFLLAVTYGKWKWSKLDFYCIMLFCFTFILWKTLDLPIIGLWGLIIAEAISTIPIFVKSWVNPKDEPLFSWFVFFIGSSINILAIPEWDMKYFLYPVYMSFSSILILLPLIMYRLKLK